MAELKITAANFENEVLHSDKPVLLDFYADWCGPCKMLSPILHELAEEKSDTLKVGKVNVDEQPSGPFLFPLLPAFYSTPPLFSPDHFLQFFRESHRNHPAGWKFARRS